MSKDDAWTSIPRPGNNQSRTEKRASPNHPLDFYRGRDASGKYLFLLKGNDLPDLTPFPSLAEINITATPLPGGAGELVLELRDPEQVSIFRALTEDVLQATEELKPEEIAKGAKTVIRRIERWQELLKRRRDNLLSRQKIIGLVGELLFLRERVIPKLGPLAAVASWRGPYGDEQDFVIGETIFEIKCQLATADKVLTISSENQLDTESGQIVVCHQTVSPAGSGTDPAESLNLIIEGLRKVFTDTSQSALDIFEAGLLSIGYFTRPEYDAERWFPVQMKVYEVEDSFPRLTPSTLPPGVHRVTYRISPSYCSEFERSEDWMEGLIHGNT